jgi:insertion element IS1 protein InsB
MTMVDRQSACVVGYRVGCQRTEAVMQAMLDEAPQAEVYYSDGLLTYGALFYAPGKHISMRDKSETYSVEGVNAALRHYLARLGRRSRCFSRCVKALRRAVKLFVHAWNQRQLYRQTYLQYNVRLM